MLLPCDSGAKTRICLTTATGNEIIRKVLHKLRTEPCVVVVLVLNWTLDWKSEREICQKLVEKSIGLEQNRNIISRKHHLQLHRNTQAQQQL